VLEVPGFGGYHARMVSTAPARTELEDTRATATRVAEEREVLTARESRRVVEHREPAELDEVIAAPPRAELCPGAILQPRGHTRHSQPAPMTS